MRCVDVDRCVGCGCDVACFALSVESDCGRSGSFDVSLVLGFFFVEGVLVAGLMDVNGRIGGGPDGLGG